jgi:hypothetical protein
MITKLFTKHPHATGETYIEHQRFAASVGLKLLGAGAAAVIHGVCPFLFVSTAGRCVDTLHGILQSRRMATHKPIA